MPLSAAVQKVCRAVLPWLFWRGYLELCHAFPPARRTNNSGLVAVELNRDLLMRLRPAAAHRNTTVPQLVRDLLEVVAADRLVDAILDDEARADV
jgi:hypothetical protein